MAPLNGVNTKRNTVSLLLRLALNVAVAAQERRPVNHASLAVRLAVRLAVNHVNHVNHVSLNHVKLKKGKSRSRKKSRGKKRSRSRRQRGRGDDDTAALKEILMQRLYRS